MMWMRKWTPKREPSSHNIRDFAMTMSLRDVVQLYFSVETTKTTTAPKRRMMMMPYRRWFRCLKFRFAIDDDDDDVLLGRSETHGCVGCVHARRMMMMMMIKRIAFYYLFL